VCNWRDGESGGGKLVVSALDRMSGDLNDFGQQQEIGQIVPLRRAVGVSFHAVNYIVCDVTSQGKNMGSDDFLRNTPQTVTDEDVRATMTAVSESAPRPHAAVGRYLRSIREQKYKTQTEFAENSEPPIDNNQISNVERGLNVRLSTLALYARALGYRSLIELFRAPSDPGLRKLLRLWALLDDEERTDVLGLVQDWIADRKE
jgi:transcriptional regulator with XRE-family HTH domain